MKKCYIAGQITGLPIKEYTDRFILASHDVIMLGYAPVNPVILPHNHDKSWESYIKEGIISLMQCQAIYMLTGWQNSKGATIERNLALTLGYEVIYEK